MTAAQHNRVRIIGGRWRGRKLDFPTIDGLRPTPDRVRETVFNWLQPVIAGARCLDLCAGTGSFGIEAVSRGAASSLLVERDAQAVTAMQTMTDKLQADNIIIHRSDALAFLAHPSTDHDRYNIVFLDPPYASKLVAPCLEQLVANGWLAAEALVYYETQKSAPGITLPASLTVLKEQRAGQVAYFLARYTGRT